MKSVGTMILGTGRHLGSNPLGLLSTATQVSEHDSPKPTLKSGSLPTLFQIQAQPGSFAFLTKLNRSPALHDGGWGSFLHLNWARQPLSLFSFLGQAAISPRSPSSPFLPRARSARSGGVMKVDTAHPVGSAVRLSRRRIGAGGHAATRPCLAPNKLSAHRTVPTMPQ